jgi:nitric oxide reductase subunit B
VWSVLSLVALLGGIGLLLAVFGRWNLLGWHGREQQSISFRAPDEVSLTPTQNMCAWFFFTWRHCSLFRLCSGATEHYRADLQTFFGIDLGRLLPSTSSGRGTCSCPSSGSLLLSCGRNFPGSDDYRPGAAGQKLLAYGLLARWSSWSSKSPRGICGNQGLIRNPWFGHQDLNISISGVSGRCC